MRNMHALLIGINQYLPNKLSNGLYYKSLWGCVQDVLRVEEFLRQTLGVPENQIIKLTSSNNDGSLPPEPPEQWPTYKNIVNAFFELDKRTQSGDQIYIHYSGHGGRCATTPEFRGIKGDNGLDEVLVPMDLGDSEGNYLRDTELQYLVKRLIRNDRFVTVVMDCCHAGGDLRAPAVEPAHAGAGIRGLDRPEADLTPRMSPSLVASPEQLREAWNNGSSGVRAIEPLSGWSLEPEGCVLLAACRASEYANEYPFEGNEKNGALSYWLLDSLRQARPGYTYKMLHDRIRAKVHGQFFDQTPQLQGEGNRLVFGREEIVPQYAVSVMKADSPEHVVLNAGQAHGVHAGARFNIFALHETDFTKTDARIATVEVTGSGATSATTRVLSSFGTAMIEPGCQGVLFDRGNVRRQRRVRFSLPAKAAVEKNTAAIREVEKILKGTANRFVQLARKKDPADFLVTIDGEARFIICDSSGMEIPNLKPDITINMPALHLVERLVHLARYFDVLELCNDEAHSPLADKLMVELSRSADKDSIDDTSVVKHRETVVLTVRNDYEAVLNVTVMNLQSDWGISQIYPARAADFEPLDPGQQFRLPMRMLVPPGCEKGTDIIKVFATVDTTSFRWLEMPSIVPPLNTQRKSLEELFKAVSSEESITRKAELLTNPQLEWTVTQLEVESIL